MPVFPPDRLTEADWLVVRASGLFRALEAPTWGALLQKSELVTAPPCGALFVDGQPADRLYLVLEGLTGLLATTSRAVPGREGRCLVDLLGAGQMVGEIGLFDGELQPVAVQAVTSVRVLAFPRASILGLVQENAGFRRFLLGAMSVRLRVLVRQLTHLKLMTASQRVGAYLLGLAGGGAAGPGGGSSGRGDPITLHLGCGRRVLAGMLGMSPESLSRAFRVLADCGVQNLGRDAVAIRNPERLRAHVRTDPCPETAGLPGWPGVGRERAVRLSPGAASVSALVLPPDRPCAWERVVEPGAAGNEKPRRPCQNGGGAGSPPPLPPGCHLERALRGRGAERRTHTLTCPEFEMVCRSPLFAAMPGSLVRSLLAEARLLTHDGAALLFSRGDPADRCFVVLSGGVKLFIVTADGRESLIDVVGPGCCFAEAAVFGPGRMPVSGETLAETRLLALPARVLLDRVAMDADFALFMLASLARRQRERIERVLEMKACSPLQRLASALLGLTAAESGAVTVRLTTTKAALAGHIGITAESLSRAMGRLGALGVTCNGPEVIIADVARLRDYSQGEGSWEGGCEEACAATA